VDHNGYIKAILWDLDGVLADTFDLHLHTWQQAMSPYGVTISRDQYLPYFGQSPKEVMKKLLEFNYGEVDFSEIRKKKEDLFNELAPIMVKPIPGSLPWLKYLSQKYLQAVASSAPMPIIEMLLGALEIRHHFQAIASGSEMNSKPAPDVFLLAADLLGVLPQNCLVIEDSPHGVDAAKAAGMRCVGLGTTMPLSALLKADILIKDLSILPVEFDIREGSHQT
jgi:HAD superfamily hydrolase (TIGR01509 family)